MKRKKTAGLIASVLLSVAVSNAYDVVGEGRTNSACGTQNDCTCNLNGFSWNPSTQRCEARANPSQCPSGSTFYSSFAGLNDVCVKPATASWSGRKGGRGGAMGYDNGQICTGIRGWYCDNDVSIWFGAWRRADYIPWVNDPFSYRIDEGINLTSRLPGRYFEWFYAGSPRNRYRYPRPITDYGMQADYVVRRNRNFFLSGSVKIFWLNPNEWAVSDWWWPGVYIHPNCYTSLVNKGITLQKNTLYVCLTRGGWTNVSTFTRRREYSPNVDVLGFRVKAIFNLNPAGKVAATYYYPLGYFYYYDLGYVDTKNNAKEGLMQGLLSFIDGNVSSILAVYHLSGRASLSCPSGWRLAGGACVQNAQPTCPAGTQYDSNNNVCYYTGF